MGLVNDIIMNYFKNKKFITIFIIFVSLTLSFLKINILSYITANIIQSINNNDKSLSYKYLFYFLIISCIYIFFYGVYKLLKSKILIELRHNSRVEILKRLLLFNNNNFNEMNFSKLNSPLVRFTNHIYYILNIIFSSLMPNLAILIIIFLFFTYKNPVIGIIFLLGNVLVILYIYYNLNSLIDVSREYECEMANSEEHIIEILNNFDKIIFRGKNDETVENFGNIIKKTITTGFNTHKYTTYHLIIINIMIYSIVFIIISYNIHLFYSKKMTTIIFVTFLTILLLYKETFIDTIFSCTDLIDFYGNLKVFLNIFKNIDSKKDLVIHNGKINKLDFNNIRFDNISYKNSNNVIFTNFNLTINTDKIIGIVGLSGQGKSTLMKLLINIYQYDGNIYIDNINTKSIDINYIRKNIVYVNQNSKLFDNTAIHNIFYGCDNNEQCMKDLEFIMSHKKIKELYKKIDLSNKKVGFSGENISGGQRQVINIINGLIVPSKILILDEPTNGLDYELKKEIMEIIIYFKKHKKAIIIISHDNDIFPIFEETIKIK